MLNVKPNIKPLWSNMFGNVLCLWKVVNTLMRSPLYDSSLFFRGISGKTYIITKSIIRFKMAAIRYTLLQPQNPAMIPLANLENKIPGVILEDTIPTIFPRSSSGLKSPARGNMIWPDIVTIPMLNSDSANMLNDGESEHESNAAMAKSITRPINLFLFRKSPNGTIKNIPKAYPIWVAVIRRPPFDWGTPKLFVI